MRTTERQRGLTLLEVLVAFSILVLTLGVLLEVFGGGLRAAGVAAEYTRATELARSTLAAVGIEHPLDVGVQSGAHDDRYRWEIHVEPHVEEDGEPPPVRVPVTLYRVRVDIYWGDGATERRFSLSSLRLGIDG